MPGIAGIICRSATGHEGQQLQTMLSCMMHEPFYTCATYQQDALGVYAGLVAIEGDYSSRIAMTNDARDIVMLFSGEIFNEAGEVRLDETRLQRSYWHGATLRRMVVEHTAGRANHSTTIRKALAVELVQRTLFACA
jgi:asparagine synthetase B (glutamine-hydrolysing)